MTVLMRIVSPSNCGSAKRSVAFRKSKMVKYSFPYSSLMRVPRPIICLNLVMELILESRTITLQVWASTPVVISSEVVAITGYFSSGLIKLSSSRLPSSLSPVICMMYLWLAETRSGLCRARAERILSAWSISTQNTMVLAKRS